MRHTQNWFLKFFFFILKEVTAILELTERSSRFFLMLFRARNNLAEKLKFHSQCYICTFAG
jgi:hypothetical protein